MARKGFELTELASCFTQNASSVRQVFSINPRLLILMPSWKCHDITCMNTDSGTTALRIPTNFIISRIKDRVMQSEK